MHIVYYAVPCRVDHERHLIPVVRRLVAFTAATASQPPLRMNSNLTSGLAWYRISSHLLGPKRSEGASMHKKSTQKLENPNSNHTFNAYLACPLTFEMAKNSAPFRGSHLLHSKGKAGYTVKLLVAQGLVFTPS